MHGTIRTQRATAKPRSGRGVRTDFPAGRPRRFRDRYPTFSCRVRRAIDLPITPSVYLISPLSLSHRPKARSKLMISESNILQRKRQPTVTAITALRKFVALMRVNDHTLVAFEYCISQEFQRSELALFEANVERFC
jgi:hypothetical protein